LVYEIWEIINERNINWAVKETIGGRNCPEIYEVHNNEKPFVFNGAKAELLKMSDAKLVIKSLI
jgi:hypothetical protein